MSNNLFADPRPVTSLDECLFYHTVDLPDHGTIRGFWDIRGKESEYLGGVGLKGKRVLEIGPASGHLSFFMERAGAEVVSVDAAEDYHWNFFWDVHDPVPKELQELLESNRGNIERIKNSYWLCHRTFGSKAKVHYGNAYDLPAELGKFDVSVLACVLLHNKNPLSIIENCARLTRETMVIVEPIREHQLSSAEILPRGDKPWWDTWWGFSPKFFVDVLRSIGFADSMVTFHTQQCVGKPEALFTVVANRGSIDDSAADGPVDVAVSSPVVRLKVKPGAEISLPVTVVNLGTVPISSFSASPVLISYHWKRESGDFAVWDGTRTFLPRIMREGDADDLFMAVRAPDEPGNYLLEISILKENVAWYDGKIDGLPLQIEAIVSSPDASPM